MGRRSVASQVEGAKKHGMLHLIQYQLTHVPPELFVCASSSSASASSASPGELAATLVRLDLSFNQLEGPQAIPDAIGSLVALRELYVNNNPRLQQLPSTLVNCAKLQVLDASSSALNSLPQELGRLQHLRMINIDDTPLQRRWEAKGHLVRRNEDDDPLIFSFEGNDNNAQTVSTTASSPTKTVQTPCQQILRKLRRKDEREQLKRELFDLLRDKSYRLERHDDRVAASAVLHTALHRVLKLFPQAIDVRSLLRNAERLFPQKFSIETFEKLDVTRIRREFDVLRTATERKKRAADLELKIRNLYFDRIDPTTVEGMVNQIYAHLPELSDIKFLIKYAPRLFPKEARHVKGEQIQRDLVALQQQFARERAAAVDKLLIAVKTLYSDTEPDSVRALVASVAALFKNTKELLSLAADAAVLFPADFLNAQPGDVRASFLRMKAEVMGGGSGVPSPTGASSPLR
ncbi:Leucine rich repeat protein [Phytophthora cinnamomi]|uniref:Leucine rich repeat protein n=1 Tax=Phytophthora cinnamomi TaxID=4785 RepID=UPI0035595301|nr:Leucine rich repeat protein [Phytophthora cinnamomi]